MSPEPRLAFVRLSVADLERARGFYRDAFGVDVDLHGAPVRLGQGGGPVEIAFVVADLDAAHARAIAAGARADPQPPSNTLLQEHAHGALPRAAAYRDPDGNLVVLIEPARPARVAGVDMAKGGWAVVVLEGNRVVDAFRCDTFADALLVDAAVIAVDIPIGMPESGARPADTAARRFVGARASSVFPTPQREVLEAETYADARRIALERTGKSVSAQTYALGRRILEVDELARTDERVIEVHPEVSFAELARRPLSSKHRLGGLVERRQVLTEAGIELPEAAPRIAEPDLLDATVAAWTAARYARGLALPLPDAHTERLGAIWR
jgi:predicted RNase H-like nuclease/catechol 2,3-dioxygenase-like lactoylglutathione lyase family enzyme